MPQSSEISNEVKQVKIQIRYGHIIFGEEISSPGQRQTIKRNRPRRENSLFPYSWKKGFKELLFKVADIPKSSCNSYRPVAYLSCFFQILKSILNNRIKECNIDSSVFPCTQQHDFQEKQWCLTASFNLHETVYHNLEQENSVYLSFLDSTKASILYEGMGS